MKFRDFPNMSFCPFILSPKSFASLAVASQVSNNNINNNNNNNSGQRALALIGWFERAIILCGGTKAQKQQSHRSNSGCWTGVLVTLIGRLCGTDPYSFMKEHVISIEEVSC